MKLSDAEIQNIKTVYRQQGGKRGVVATLARQYGVTRPTIYAALNNYERSVKKGVQKPWSETRNFGVGHSGTPHLKMASKPHPGGMCELPWCGSSCGLCGAVLLAEYGPPLFYVSVGVFECGVCGGELYGYEKTDRDSLGYLRKCQIEGCEEPNSGFNHCDRHVGASRGL